jgi:hypothetical protein
MPDAADRGKASLDVLLFPLLTRILRCPTSPESVKVAERPLCGMRDRTGAYYLTCLGQTAKPALRGMPRLLLRELCAAALAPMPLLQ